MEKRTYKGYTINIEQDTDAENPFLNWDGQGQITFSENTNYQCNTELSFYEATQTPLAVSLSAYIHGGIMLSVGTQGTNCRFDTSHGIAVFTPDQINDPINTQAEAEEKAKQACTLYNQWANGEVYGFIVEDKQGLFIDSCFGYFGDTQEAIDEAERVIDCQIEALEEGAKQFHAMA